jgi:hypothetical protein
MVDEPKNCHFRVMRPRTNLLCASISGKKQTGGVTLPLNFDGDQRRLSKQVNQLPALT